MKAEKTVGDILVVDDSLANLELLMLVLDEKGYHVRTARSGVAALNSVKDKVPDLVLLDIGMPGMDGYEVCRRLKADEAASKVPVIFLSGFATIEDKQQGFDAGCVDYVTKPFHPDEILFRIETHLELSRMRARLEQQASELGLAKKSLERSVEELKRSQKALIQSEKLASLGRLVSEIAHEVNNPLMIISGNAQLSLMSDSVKGEEKESFEMIVKECQRAKNVIRRVLRFAKPSKGEIKEVAITQSIEAVAGLLEKQFMLSGNVEIKRCPPENEICIPADELQMQEVFMNLLNNAKEAMPHGGVITITTFVEGAFVRIDFKDTGHGMSEEVMSRIMEPFFTTKESGTGVGLAVCYGIIKAHNGELRFESDVGKGTTATILLPLRGNV